MDMKEFRAKSPREMEALLKEKRSRIDELRFLLHQQKVKNVKELRQVRRDMARILTVFGEIHRGPMVGRSSAS